MDAQTGMQAAYLTTDMRVAMNAFPAPAPPSRPIFSTVIDQAMAILQRVDKVGCVLAECHLQHFGSPVEGIGGRAEKDPRPENSQDTIRRLLEDQLPSAIDRLESMAQQLTSKL